MEKNYIRVMNEIKQAKEKNITRLTLSGRKLKKLPNEIGELKNLTFLDISSNELEDLPEEISQLSKLKSIDISSNRIKHIPKQIFSLLNLKTLYASKNIIEDLPDELSLLQKLTSLSLSSNELNQFPMVVIKLEKLKMLNLHNNRIKEVPNSIENLSYMQTIDLSRNELKDLPEEIKRLKRLSILLLASNKLNHIPDGILSLNNIKTLDLTNNQIEVIPNEIEKLYKLGIFYISKNFIKDIPKELGNLNELRTLGINNNEIEEIPKELGNLKMIRNISILNNKITKLPKELFNAKKLKFLNVYNNPIEEPPIQIANQSVAAIINYFHSVEKQETTYLYEAKLIIVGRGEVGKTSLMKKLTNPQIDINIDEKSTDGIKISPWLVDTKLVNNFRINFWDFGGQEIYHATHQFFLTKGCLYIFVWDARIGEDIVSFDYWLNSIELLSENSPIIVVLNKTDIGLPNINEKSYKVKFKNIIGFNKVSALTGAGITDLTNIIKDNIVELKHIGTTLPKVWIEIRQELENLRKDFISYKEYKEICNRYTLNEIETNYLSQYFHVLGVFLNFNSNDILRDIVFLNPDWVTNAVYKILDSKMVQEKEGRFTFDELHYIWSDYPEDKYLHILELMKKFELCFKLNDYSQYVVPAMLADKEINFDWNYNDNIMFEYLYDFMPAGILTRFMVNNSMYIKNNMFWKSGIILEVNGTKGLIISEPLYRRIRIRISGEEKQELLSLIKIGFEYIHKTLKNPPVKMKFPCYCEECMNGDDVYFHDYKTLKKAKSKGKKYIMCQNSCEEVSIDKLLCGINDQDYYNEGEITVKIENFNNYGQTNIADKIDSISFSGELGISKMQFEDICKYIDNLSKQKLDELKNEFGQKKLLYNDTEKFEIGTKIKQFFIKNGIPVTQSITAAIIFETCKHILGF
ncbi:GTP-binding protein [Clostridium estertheticum]|uniref:COR domain-containing protein n=1 Tax=Clostridium estertheticum TaxID=238834 RepID=UPI001C6EFE6E|nr:COR domain-containing protein [Clostridium estertheticum]MBW9173429.1 GTP-binding protein [Clostridium estertheticum]WLC76569.1 GTP-binding protein [Clostridium estertheticum]